MKKCFSQNGSYTRPQSGLHSSARPGYQFVGHTPVPPAQPAMQFGSFVISVLRDVGDGDKGGASLLSKRQAELMSAWWASVVRPYEKWPSYPPEKVVIR